MAEGVANTTTPHTGIAKIGAGIARKISAEGVANLITLPTGWQNWDMV